MAYNLPTASLVAWKVFLSFCISTIEETWIFWDPAWINALAAARTVIAFDNAGVGRSTGTVPETFQGSADGVISSVNALGLKQIDLLRYSMGGAAVQMAASTIPHLVRKLILAGTTASMPGFSSSTRLVWPRELAPEMPYTILSTAVSPNEVKKAFAQAWFYIDQVGTVAVNAHWNRRSERTVAGEPLNLEFLTRESTKRQQRAVTDWNPPSPCNSSERLEELNMPILVINGDKDVLVPSSRSWELASNIPNV